MTITPLSLTGDCVSGPIGARVGIVVEVADSESLYVILRNLLFRNPFAGKLVLSEKVVTEEGAHTLTFDNKRQCLYAFLPKSQCAAVYSEE